MKFNMIPLDVIYIVLFCLYLTLLNNFSFVATAKPGRVVGPVLHYEYARIIKSSNDPRVVYQNTTQAVSSHDVFRTHPPKHKTTTDIHKDFSQNKNECPSQQSDLQAKPTTYLNNYPYCQQSNNSNLNEIVIAYDAKLMQAQSHLGVVDAAAVAVATHSHRYSRTIQYSLS
jgi:hypothetical protein